MNQKILAMALGLSALATPAMADTFNLGDLNTGHSGSYSNIETFQVVGGGSVSSTYNFTLAQSSIVHLSLTDQSKLTGLTATLTGPSLSTVIGPLAYNGAQPSGDWQSTTPLAAGNYSIGVSGVFNTNRVAGYALSLTSQVAAPVPGPAGFIVAGAGALIVAARKRRKARVAVA